MSGSQSGHAIRSRVLRFKSEAQESHLPYAWEGIPVAEYKQAAQHWRGVSRTVLTGEQGESTAFHVRYFELAPGGFTSCEEHKHEHTVVVLRGRGEVQLGPTTRELHFGDTVYVAPHEAHQFRNPSATEPFGFLCIVDAQRDKSVVLSQCDI
jgi:ribulose-bisphosphate carboxylase large chain